MNPKENAIPTKQNTPENYDMIHSYKSLSFGLIKGSEGILIIKVGAMGNIYGYENKYLHTARKINALYHFSVIVSSTPDSVSDEASFDITFEYAKIYSTTQKKRQSIYYMGVSKGALYGAQFGWKHPEIKKLLLINMPLMINWHRSKAGLQQSRQQKYYMAFGESDPSYPYIRFAELLQSEAIHVFSVDGQDHNFNQNVFIELLSEYLFSD